MASRTIGIDRENSSKVGIEGSYNEYLKGENVKSLMRRMPGGYWLPVQEIDNVSLAKGADLITNLDVRIQDIVHEEVLKQLHLVGSEAGVGIVMEVKTGKVVAMTNLSKGKDDIYREERNYAIGEKFAPGSVFKGATVLALLDDGFMTPDDLIDIERGTKRFWDRTVRDVTDIGKGNPVTFRDAMVFSSNVAMAKLSNHFYNKSWDDRKKFINKLRSFGLGDITGIDLIGEAIPVIKDTDKNRNDFYRTTIPWMSHGYETEYTPIQILNFYNAIANGGKLMKPYLVDRIERRNKPVQIKPQVLIEKIASDSALSILQSFLEGVVLEGTATSLRSLGVRVAGKTGTAQVGLVSNIEDMKYNSTFAGYFPVEDPKYSIIVVFYKNPRNAYYASHTVVPVFKNIVEKMLSLQAIEVERSSPSVEREIARAELPGFGTGYSQDFRTIFEHSSVPYLNKGNSDWGIIDHEGNSVKVESFNFKTKLVPDVRGMGVRDAVYILENLGLTVKIEGHGRVTLQSIAPHTRLNSQTVILTLK
jgi:cell division protein FtsI (penicillin-binding protein 3)